MKAEFRQAIACVKDASAALKAKLDGVAGANATQLVVDFAKSVAEKLNALPALEKEGLAGKSLVELGLAESQLPEGAGALVKALGSDLALLGGLPGLAAGVVAAFDHLKNDRTRLEEVVAWGKNTSAKLPKLPDALDEAVEWAFAKLKGEYLGKTAEVQKVTEDLTALGELLQKNETTLKDIAEFFEAVVAPLPEFLEAYTVGDVIDFFKINTTQVAHAIDTLTQGELHGALGEAIKKVEEWQVTKDTLANVTYVRVLLSRVRGLSEMNATEKEFVAFFEEPSASSDVLRIDALKKAASNSGLDLILDASARVVDALEKLLPKPVEAPQVEAPPPVDDPPAEDL